MTDSASHQSRCCYSESSPKPGDHAFAQLFACTKASTSDEFHTQPESALLLIGIHERSTPYQDNTAEHGMEKCDEATRNGVPALTTPLSEGPVPAGMQAPLERSEGKSEECRINSARSQISPTTIAHKHSGEVTVAADDARFVDVLFHGIKLFTVGKVEILIVRHKRNRLLEMIVCADGTRVEVGHFYVRHEDLLSVVSQKDIQTRLRLAVQSWTGDGLPEIRSLLRCATTMVMVEYLLDHLDVSIEESHHRLSNLVAQFLPDEASGKQLPPMVLTEKPAQVPKLRWQPCTTSMDTITECPESRENSMHRNTGTAMPALNRMQARENANAEALADAAGGMKRMSPEVVRVKPHRHNSMFSYFSPFSGSARLRTRSSDAREELEEEEGHGGAPVCMFQQLLNAMRAQSMRVLPTDTDTNDVGGKVALKRHMSMSTMSLSSGFGEVCVSSRSAPPAVNIPTSG